MPPKWNGLVKAQYLAHRIFKQQGLIHKYLNHAAIKNRESDEVAYLEKTAAAHPWRFSFSKVCKKPADDFYEMEDVFTGDNYLLYSKAITQIMAERPVLLFFNLIAFNGGCWQTFGPVTGYQSFDADDIFFFASELNPSITSDEELLIDVEKNPVPYMMLTYGSAFPQVQQNGLEIVQVYGECLVDTFDFQKLRQEFKVEYNAGVFRLSDREWSAAPHFGEAYYDEQRETLSLAALTDRAYDEMSKRLNANGFSLPVDPDIRLHLTMLNVVNEVLRKKPDLFPQRKLFEAARSPAMDRESEKINEFLSLLLPYINQDQQPDINALAMQTGIDFNTAMDLFRAIKKRAGK